MYLTIPSEAVKELAQQKVHLISSQPPSSSIQVPDTSEMVSKFTKYGVDWLTVTALGTGAAIQTETVPQSMFSKVDTFYCCVRCGKVFWEGTHFERVCEQFSYVLGKSTDGPTVYEKLNENFS